MSDREFDDIQAEAETKLLMEYRDISAQFKYVIETERRFYLANNFHLERVDVGETFYFDLSLEDVWVWDVYRSNRLAQKVRVFTFKDVNVEELNRSSFKLPRQFLLGD